jgi:FG-GAP-like repeat
MPSTAALVVLALVCASSSLSVAAEIRFKIRDEFAVGRSPSAFAFADGKEGRLFVAADEGISVWRPDAGAWIPAGVVDAIPYVKSLAVADLNGDGRADVAFLSRDADGIAVLLARDDGSFQAPLAVPLGFTPRLLRAGPLRRGAGAVLLVVHAGGLSVVRAGESGTFTTTLVDDSPLTRDVDSADLNDDDALDLVLASDGTDSLRILHAAAGGGFLPAAELPTLGRPKELRTLRGEHGGVAALVVVSDRGLVVHRRKDRAFEKPELIWNEPHLGGMAVADVDGDGRPDVAVTNRSRATITLFRGREEGSLLQAQSYTVGRAPDAALLADFDADGTVDALALNELGDSVTVLRGQGKGRFDATPCILGEVEDFDAIAATDFDGDGNLDLAVTSRAGGSVSVFLGEGFGHFTPRPPVRVGRQPRGIVADEFDGDDKPDLAIVNFGGDDVAILAGDGHGGFDVPILVPVGLGPTVIVAGTFSGEGHVDLAVANSLSKSVSILYGDRRGRFPEVVNFPVESTPTFLLTADVDGDGHVDLVVGNERAEAVSMLHGNGKRLGPPQTNTLETIARPSIVEDFNRDGRLDLVVLQEADDAVEILPGAEGGGFDTPLRFPVGRNPSAAATGDFDGDGRVDLAVVNGATRTITILLNRTSIPTHHQVANTRRSAIRRGAEAASAREGES